MARGTHGMILVKHKGANARLETEVDELTTSEGKKT